MKESTKKKTVKSSSPAVHSGKKVVSSESNTTTLLLVVILALGVIQLLLTFTMIGGNSSSNTSGISDLSEKVDRLDAFFAANAPGYGDGTSAPSAGTQQAAPSSPKVVGEPNIEGAPALGSADAPITIVEYSDFECPFCGKFYSETYGQLKEKYIDTGKVRLVFKDFPLSFHEMAEPAAIASKCVFREAGNDAFFAFHNTLFENQATLSDANLKKWALAEGLSEDAYNSCIVDSTVKDQVQADFSEGQSFGVSGTPSFVINGQLIVGAQPFTAFEQVIESALN